MTYRLRSCLHKYMNQKGLLIGGVVFLILAAVVTAFVFTRGKSDQKDAVPTPTPTPDEIIELLPSDALDVSLEPGRTPLYVLTIDNLPDGLSSLSYEITYDTTNKGAQGIVGSPVTLKEGQAKYVNDKLVFGSESKGKYDLDKGVNNIQINIRLTYSDGSEKGWKSTLQLP